MKQYEYTILGAVVRKCASAAVGFSAIVSALNFWALALLTERGWCVFWIFMMALAMLFAACWIATPMSKIKYRKRR